MVEFIIERYNYWIAIILMMTGLYIVFSRGNLVKKIIGLNIFQTSVFIYYISIGKVDGGTAPIFLGGHGDGEHGQGDHGEGDHGEAGHNENGHGDGHGAESTSAPDKINDHAVQTAQSLHQSSQTANDIAHGAPGSTAQLSNESLHTLGGDLAHNATKNVLASEPFSEASANLTLDVSEGAKTLAKELTNHVDGAHAGTIADLAGDGVEHGVAHNAVNGAEILYSNPLPHVLILTAIVVGVATTAVGLALAVRIREAYGTIEEDELEVADDIAEFGEEASIANPPAGEAA